MTSTDSSVSGTVRYQTDDDLSEANLTATAAKGNQSDYVERGLGFALSGSDLTIGNGLAVVRDGTQAWEVEPQQTTITLPNGSGNNHVYLVADVTSDDVISYHIDGDQSPPADPSLYLGVVDTGAATTTEANRAPDGEFEGLGATELTSGLDGGQNTVANLGGATSVFAEGVLSALGSFEAFVDVNADISSNFMVTGYVSVAAQDGTDRTTAMYRFMGSPGNPITTELVEQDASAGGGGLSLNVDYSSPTYQVQVQADSSSGWSNPPEIYCSVLAFGRDLEVTIVS